MESCRLPQVSNPDCPSLAFIAQSKYRNTRDDEIRHSLQVSARQYIDVVKRIYM